MQRSKASPLALNAELATSPVSIFANAAHHMSKRTRASRDTEDGRGDRSPPKHVFLLGIDNQTSPVRAGVSLLKHYGCRMAGQIEKDECAYRDKNGDLYFYVSTTRAATICFLKSLAVGHLCFTSEASYSEMLSIFEYEGVSIPGLNEVVAFESEMKSVSDGVGLGLSTRPAAISREECVRKLCEQIAAALVEWPRLLYGLENSLSTCDGKHNRSVGFACSPTRAWIKFASGHRPQTNGVDHTHAICDKRPFWVTNTLYSFGVIRDRMIRMNRITAEDTSEKAFVILRHAIDEDVLGSFSSTRVDVPSAWRGRARKLFADAESWLNNIIKTVVDAGSKTDATEASQLSQSVKFARALVVLAFERVSQLPKLASIFSVDCADDKGSTLERVALAKSLKLHKIKILRWGRHPNALVFPPSMRHEITNDEADCVLLQFEE